MGLADRICAFQHFSAYGIRQNQVRLNDRVGVNRLNHWKPFRSDTERPSRASVLECAPDPSGALFGFAITARKRQSAAALQNLSVLRVLRGKNHTRRSIFSYER